MPTRTYHPGTRVMPGSIVTSSDEGDLVLVSPGEPGFDEALALSQLMHAPVAKDSEQNVIVADIDGCCIFSEHRLPFLLEGDADTYHQHHLYDRPIPQGVAVYRKFHLDPCYRVYFVTSRVEAARDYTLWHLRDWIHPSIRNDQLLMRPAEEDDWASTTKDKVMPDTVLKPKLLRDIGIEPRHIFMVFEDRTSVVKMWRKQGVVVYQPAWGDY